MGLIKDTMEKDNIYTMLILLALISLPKRYLRLLISTFFSSSFNLSFDLIYLDELFNKYTNTI